MTHAETELILAEAALKGLISEDPETHYRRGIESSMMYYGVDFGSFGWNDFDDFYTNSGIAYSGDLDQVWEQKWAAIFFHGLEPFFETRRWHYEVNFNFDEIPFQEAPCENNNGDILPLRFLYPGEEQSLNAANYQDAVEKLGGSDNQNAVMWLMED
jgi:hypothetical protein